MKTTMPREEITQLMLRIVIRNREIAAERLSVGEELRKQLRLARGMVNASVRVDQLLGTFNAGKATF